MTKGLIIGVNICETLIFDNKNVFDDDRDEQRKIVLFDKCEPYRLNIYCLCLCLCMYPCLCHMMSFLTNVNHIG